MTVLILGGHDDEHACTMLEHLRKMGTDAEMLDSRWFPTQMTIAFDPISDRATFHFPNDRVVDSSEITSIYWRCYNGVETPELPDEEQHYIAANDARSMFESMLIRLPVRWVNGWNAFQLHQTKPVQLAMVAKLGVPVPATMLGNDPDAVRHFATELGPVIFKPVQGGAHTQRVTPMHLTEENLVNLACAPITLQEEIGGTNIRVFVAGRRVLSCEVRTGEIDFRDDEAPTIEAHDLPEAVVQQSREIAKTLDLLWTGIDFRLTDDGQYVFLEANPSPMFLGFEEQSGLPLTESLTSLLTEPVG